MVQMSSDDDVHENTHTLRVNTRTTESSCATLCGAMPRYHACMTRTIERHHVRLIRTWSGMGGSSEFDVTDVLYERQKRSLLKPCCKFSPPNTHMLWSTITWSSVGL